MGVQPRRNEDRFYRYPMNRVAAIVDDEPGVEKALRELEQVGMDVAGVNVLSGPEGARLLDRSGTGHGWRARLLRVAQRGAFEADALRLHDRALHEGRNVVFVPVRGETEKARVASLLRASGGYDLLYFRRWSIEELPG